MPRTTFPVEFTAELRGVVPASEFNDRTTGELVKLAPTLQLEADNEDGSVDLHHVRSAGPPWSLTGIRWLARAVQPSLPRSAGPRPIPRRER